MYVVTKTIGTTAFTSYQIFGFVIIFLIFASIIYYTKDVLYSEWRKMYPVNELTGETPLQSAFAAQDNINKSAPAQIDYSKDASGSQATGILMGAQEAATNKPVLEGPASADQTWCLVGEDMAGRWCIQVQSPAGCEPVRTYKTKNQCERSNDASVE